jgi:hypothetical protein
MTVYGTFGSSKPDHDLVFPWRSARPYLGEHPVESLIWLGPVTAAGTCCPSPHRRSVLCG